MRKAYLLASAAFLSTFVLNPQAFADGNPASGLFGPTAVDPFVNGPSSLPPVLQIIEANGIKITALTPAVGGLNGYLLESPEGKMQVIYLSADGKSFVAGVQQALSPDGKSFVNVTTLQFSQLKQRFDSAREQVAAQERAAEEAREQADEARKKADAAAALLAQQAQQMNAPDAQALTTSGHALQLPDGGTPATPSANASPSPPAITPDPTPPVAAVPLPSPPTPSAPSAMELPQSSQAGKLSNYVTNVSPQAFRSEMETSNYIAFGHDPAHTIYLVADPQCPHCHKVWQQLAPLIAARAIAVNLIIVDALPGSNAIAATILGDPNPGARWVDAEMGKALPAAPVPGSQADRTAQGYLQGNRNVLQAENITGVPWMGYVGKDGKVYERSGDDDVTTFLSGL